VNPLGAESIYLFRHALLREAAYSLQAPSARAALHRAALEVLEELARVAADSDSWAEELAYHARAAQGQTGDTAALHGRELHWLRRAAGFATRTWANEAALDAWQRLAVHPLAQAADRVRANTHLAEILMRTGVPVRAEAPIARALADLEACDDPAARGECLAMRARLLVVLGRYPEARRQCEQAFEPARQAGPATLGQLCNVAAQAAAAVGDWREAESRARQALEVLDPGRDPGVRARATMHLADFLWRQGRLPEAEHTFGQAVELARASRNPGLEASSLDHLGSLMRELGHPDRARELHRQAGALYGQVGDTVGVAATLVNLSTLDQAEGRLAEARVSLLRAIAHFRAGGTVTLEAIALGNLGGVARKLGRLAESAAAYERARALLARTGSTIETAVFDGLYAQLLLLAGYPDAAEVNARQAMDTLERQGARHWREQYGGLVFLRVLAHRAAEGSAASERAARERLAEMRSVLEKADYNGRSGLAQMVERGQSLLEELSAAQTDKRPPLLFRGFRPQELEPEVRKALLARMRQVEPESHARLTAVPQLWQALNAGLEDIAEPDWQASEV
jgi:tetratricopeptide (TPR) repeat protein